MNEKVSLPLQIEITFLETLLKKNANDLLNKLAKEIEILHEFEAKSTNSFNGEEESQSSDEFLINKMAIKFNSYEDANKFFEHVQRSKLFGPYELSNVTRKALSSTNSNSSLADSIIVYSEGSLDKKYEFDYTFDKDISFENDNTQARDFTIYSSMGDSLFTLNNKSEDASSQTESFYSKVKEENDEDENVIEFYSPKAINENDLESLILFLENPKRSGGSDILSSELYPKNHTLKIIYESKKAKKRVLERRKHVFKGYILTANIPFNLKNFELNLSAIILQNVPGDIDIDKLTLYCEYLILNDDEENDVNKVSRSQIFKDTFYVEFKSVYDAEKLKNRLNKKKLANISVSMINAYDTKTVVVRSLKDSNNSIDNEKIEAYFNNKHAESCKSIKEMNAFLLITFDTQEYIDKLLTTAHVVENRKLSMEYLHNFELLNDDLLSNDSATLIDEIKVEPTVSEQNPFHDVNSFKSHSNQSSSSTIENEEMETTITETAQTTHEDAQTSNEPIRDFPTPIIIVKNNKLVEVLSYWDNLYFSQFSEELSEMDCNVIKNLEDDESIFKLEYSAELPRNEADYINLKEKWTNEINAFLKKYFAQFDIREVEIKSPMESMNKIYEFINSNNSKLKINLKKLDNKEVDSLYEISGFRKSLYDLLNFIQSENYRVKQIETKEIEDGINNMKLYQIRILYVNKFIKKINSIFENVKVLIDPKNGLIIRGKSSDVVKTKELANEMLSSIKSKQIPATEALLKFINTKEITVDKWLKSNDILATIEVVESSKVINIYAIETDQIDKCFQDLFIDAIIRSDIPISGQSKASVCSFLKQFDNSSDGVALYSNLNDTIEICGFSDFHQHTYEKCLDFIYQE